MTDPKGFRCTDDSPCNTNGSGDYDDYDDVRFMVFEEEPDEDEEIDFGHTEQPV